MFIISNLNCDMIQLEQRLYENKKLSELKIIDY